jgi:hypothetical protein
MSEAPKPQKRDVNHIEIIAGVTYEAIRVLLHPDGLEPWSQASRDAKLITLEMVAAVIGGADAEMLHLNDIKVYIFNGWVYGPEFNETLKTSPALVPYAQLSDAQKAEFELSVEFVQAAARAIGLLPKSTILTVSGALS